MRYRCISVLEEYICTQDYTPFGGPAWGLPVKMLNIFTPKARGLRPLGSGSRAPLWTPLARTLVKQTHKEPNNIKKSQKQKNAEEVDRLCAIDSSKDDGSGGLLQLRAA